MRVSVAVSSSGEEPRRLNPILPKSLVKKQTPGLPDSRSPVETCSSVTDPSRDTLTSRTSRFVSAGPDTESVMFVPLVTEIGEGSTTTTSTASREQPRNTVQNRNKMLWSLIILIANASANRFFKTRAF